MAVVPVRTVNEEEYASSFATYVAGAESEYLGMKELSRRLAESLQGCEVDLLLIGPGMGIFENDLVKDIFPASDVKVRSALAFEPNPSHVPHLRGVMSQWNCHTDLHPEYFGLDSDLAGRQFDLVLFVHSCYMMPKKIRSELMDKALQVLKPAGRIIVYTQADGDDEGTDQFVEFVHHFNDRLDFGDGAPYADHEVTAETLQVELTEALPGSSWSIIRTPADLDVSCILQDPDGKEAASMLSFMVSVPPALLPLDLQQQMREWIACAASAKHTINHPASVLIGQNCVQIQNDDNAAAS